VSRKSRSLTFTNEPSLTLPYQWAGGDAVAKAINWTGSAGYASAQYAEIQTNDSYVGGLVRQHGNLSYIRTYQAGHSIPSYQPETAYKIFTRALFNLDIATGTQSTAETVNAYTSTGRVEPDVQLEPTDTGLSYCYTYAASSCYDWQVDMIQNGTAEICNWLFVDKNTTQLFPGVIAKCRADWVSHSNGTGNHSNPTPPPSFEGSAVGLGGGMWNAVLGAAVVAVGSVMMV
jgi:hypothetical protein